MKKIVHDFLSTNEEEVRGSTLKIEDLMSIDQCHEDLEEAHYIHTINAFVELIVLYGYDKVTGDLRTAMGEVKW